MKEKNIFKTCLITVMLFCIGTCACAQSKITGRVIDDLLQPMAFANVMLLNGTDSSFIKGAITRDDGTFVIDADCKNGLLKLSSVGYQTIFIAAKQGNVGDIKMQPVSQTLGEVVIKGERPQYKMTAGGMAVDIHNSMLKDVGTADDVLSMLPYVQGEDGKFTVFAKGTPEIYINNKKVQDVQELKQLKSTDIKSVSIITSPGAKYNAEVGAVIRIKTIKPQGDGFGVETYSWLSYNKKWANYDDATVKYRTGGLELTGSMALNHANYSEDNTLATDIYTNGNHINISQYAPNSFWYTLINGKIGASYDFNVDNSIGFSYKLNGSIYQGATAQTLQAIKRNDVLEGNVDQLMTAQMSDNPQHEANIYYVGKAGKLGIDFNGTWVWKKATRDQASYEKSQQLGNRDVHTFNVNRNNLLAGKLVLSYPVWKGELSVGSEISRSNNHGVYTNMEQVLLPSDDEIKESNTAAFAEYQLNLGEWSLGGGLRYESVNSDYYSFGNFQTEPSRKYRDWFPNITLGWEKNKWGIQLGYDKRISRPSYRSLNSNVQYDNRYQYEGGNPLLHPTIKQNLSLNVTYSWLSFIAGYRRDKDVQQSFGSLYKEGTEITIWTDRNFDKAEFYNLSLTASPKFGFYLPTLTVSYWQQNFDTKAHGIDRKLNKPEWEFDFRNWFTLNKATKAMLYLHYTTSYYNGFTYYNHGFKVNARIQKKFFDGKINTVIFANDIFRTMRDSWTGYFPVTTISRDAYTFTQSIGASITYNFNTSRSKYKGTGAGNAEKDRL
jgi:hypothetical protein